MAFVYILQSQKNSRYYIGSTNDLERRLKEYRSGKNKSTKYLRPLILVFNQEYNNLGFARKIELKLKKMKSKHILGKIIEEGKIKFMRE